VQSRCLRGGEEEYPANISFHDILGPSEFFVLCALLFHLTFELIGLYYCIQNSNLSDHDQRIRELETECERYFFLVHCRSGGIFYSTRFVRYRLRRSEDDLRDELDSARSDAYAREGDLLERIRELEDAQWSSRVSLVFLLFFFKTVLINDTFFPITFLSFRLFCFLFCDLILFCSCRL